MKVLLHSESDMDIENMNQMLWNHLVMQYLIMLHSLIHDDDDDDGDDVQMMMILQLLLLLLVMLLVKM